MSQNIEFYLNPPSPIQETTKCHLPPVSSLLLSPSSTETDLPRLCLEIPSPSLSSCSSLLEPYSSTTSSPSLSPFMNALSLVDSLPSPQTSPGPAFLLPPPPPAPTTRCRSLSNASNNSTNDQNTLSDPPIYNTDVKRKRGRPPNSPSKAKQHDHWTFVTPTICDIKQQNIQPLTDKQQQQQQEEEEKEDEDFTVLHWPTNQSFITNNAMPKKKRGRKPKVQLAGNFCFVWRDLTARRGVNKKKKSPPL